MGNPILSFIGAVSFENKRSIEDLATDLQTSTETLSKYFASVTDNETARKWLNHIIGIERWGQRRLRVALGEPFVRDEYDGYRPPRETTWAQLQNDFRTTRAETAALAQRLRDKAEVRIEHNTWGNFTVRGWLRYLYMHATLHKLQIR
jgi:hypothetical protein